MRTSARAWLCRWVERREPIAGRCVRRDVHCAVDSKSFAEEEGNVPWEIRAERRRISSRSSVGRGLDGFLESRSLGGETSTSFSAIWRR